MIEDAAQSFGATYKGRKSGNLSTIGCTSFFPSKPLGCYGDGGAIFTRDAVLIDTAEPVMADGLAAAGWDVTVVAPYRTVAAQPAAGAQLAALSADEVSRLALPMGREALPLRDRAVDAAMKATGPDTITKFLFTSGSTKLPKAVINTNRMCCANQQQMSQSMPVLREQPLVLVDWLPWNHTFGGNHNFGMVIYHGGTLYIDDGKPTPALIGETLRNLREIAPTVYFNVPTGFEAIANAMKTDDVLRKNFLSRVKMFFYAGAALAQPVWDSLYESEEREVGERIVMTSGLGMTESGPFALFVTNPHVRAGDLGVPTPGMELKLIDMDGKTEVRYRGPNITPGYWRAPAETTDAFDEEGFFKTGDAVKWIDETDVHLGLKFDGRIAEDFKLATGTFVSVGPLRGKIIAAGAPYIQDVVLTGLNLKEVGAMVFPTPKVRELAGLSDTAPLADVLATPAVLAHMQKVVNEARGKGAMLALNGQINAAREATYVGSSSASIGTVTNAGSATYRSRSAYISRVASANRNQACGSSGPRVAMSVCSRMPIISSSATPLGRMNIARPSPSAANHVSVFAVRRRFSCEPSIFCGTVLTQSAGISGSISSIAWRKASAACTCSGTAAEGMSSR